MPTITKIRAIVRRVTYYSPSWSAVSFEDIENKDNVFNAVGTLPEMAPGDIVTLNGEWAIHETYGEQLKILSYEMGDGPISTSSTAKPLWRDISFGEVVEDVPTAPARIPATRASSTAPRSESVLTMPTGTYPEAAVLRYLKSSFIKGLGDAKARLLYSKFHSNVFKVIERTPDRLREISGIGYSAMESICASYEKNKQYLPLRAALDNSVTDHQVSAIYAKYNEKSLHILSTDPYRLIDDIDGFGFKKADAVAMAYGVRKDSPCRIQGAIMHILNEQASKGHCFAYSPTILDQMDACVGTFPNNEDLVADAIKQLSIDGRIKVDKDGAIWPIKLYFAEVSVATRIKALSHPKKMFFEVPSAAVEYALFDVKDSTIFDLEDTQQHAVRSVYDHPFSVVTGGPGTGKTTIIKAILHVWRKIGGAMDAVAMLAPTGKAARRITEVTGNKAYTIHQQTAITPGSNPIEREYTISPDDIGLVIVDEGSMIDITLANRLLSYINDGTRVVIIGDKDQLPSIGPGNFFWELCRATLAVPRVELKLSFRQHGSIATNAYRLNNGSGVHAFKQDDSFRFISAKKDETQKLTLDAYYELVKEYGVENVCLLTPTRQKGLACTDVLNSIIQEHINPRDSKKPELVRTHMTLRVGDRVVCNQNMWRKNVANGDIGTIMSIPPGRPATIEVLFDSGEYTTITNREINHLSLAYALTIHKSQGSEYLGVVVVFAAEHWYMRQRNLLYTAVTRAKEKLRLVGDARAIAAAIDKNDAPERNTKLKERLQ